MLKIRLSMTGKRHEPHYRIVVLPTRSKRDGKVVATLGHWHPKQNQLVLDRNLYQEWLTRGAQPSEKVRELIKQ
jgi:small subunit ribosomal protein S16